MGKLFKKLWSRKKNQEPKDPFLPDTPSSALVYGYISRNKNGKLELHTRKPIRLKIFGEWNKGICGLPPYLFPNLKWEHDPIPVTLRIEYPGEKLIPIVEADAD